MADQVYVSILGSKQGRFNGESPGKIWKSPLVSVVFDGPFQSLRDPSAGHASGKRQWKPIKIVKEWGASSPQLLQALTSDECLNVTIEFIKTDSSGREVTDYTIKLASAKSLKILSKGSPPRSRGTGSSLNHNHEIEEIELTFQKIDVENKGGKTAFHDDWLN